MPKTILVLSFTDQRSDPRVDRQIRILGAEYTVLGAGTGASDRIRLSPSMKGPLGKLRSLFQLLAGRYEGYYWRQGIVRDALAKLADVKPDLVVANDIETLPLALKLGRPVVFDAHEYAPREFETLSFKLLHKGFRTYLCREYIPRAASMITVCPSIASEYERITGINAGIMINAPDYAELSPSAPHSPIRLVHHGIALKARRIERMIEMMGYLDASFELNFLMVGDVEELKRRAAPYPNICFLPPVPMRELPQYLNQFDIGVFLLEPTNFNYRMALPNKLFEFIQARLAVAVGPSPEMARIVREHDVGVVSEDFSPASLAGQIAKLDASRIAHFKSRSHKAARLLSTEQTREILLEAARRALAP